MPLILIYKCSAWCNGKCLINWIDSVIIQKQLSVVNTVKTHSVQGHSSFCNCFVTVVNACANLANDKTHMYRCLPQMQTCPCNDASRKLIIQLPCLNNCWKLLKDLLKSLQFQQVFISMSQVMTNLIKHHINKSGPLAVFRRATHKPPFRHEFGSSPRYTGQYVDSIPCIWFEHILFCLHISMIFSDTCKSFSANT